MGSSNVFRQTPGRVLLAAGITAALVAVFTVVDRTRRLQLEGLEFPSALGDREFFPFGESYDPEQVVMQFDGEPLYRLRRKPLDRYDKYMVKVGREDGDRCYLYLYKNIESRRLGTAAQEENLWAKVADGSYIELGLSPRGSDAEEGGDGVQPADGVERGS